MAADLDVVSRNYDAHAGALYGVLLIVTGCEQCAGSVLVETFNTASGSEEHMSLHRLLRTALGSAYEMAKGARRAERKERIAAWYQRAKTTGLGPEIPSSDRSESVLGPCSVHKRVTVPTFLLQ